MARARYFACKYLRTGHHNRRTRPLWLRDATVLPAFRGDSVSQPFPSIRRGAIAALTLWRNRPIRFLIVCGLLLVAAIAGGTALMVESFKERALAGSQRE